jgi:hypothetical protein
MQKCEVADFCHWSLIQALSACVKGMTWILLATQLLNTIILHSDDYGLIFFG